MIKKIFAKILQRQAERYLHVNDFTVVCITGSVGKTSTTQAIAAVLAKKYKIRTTKGNYNSEIGVPLSIFDQDIPSNLRSPLGWMKLFSANRKTIMSSPDFEVLVLELGTDMPGDIAEFAWLDPDISVVTAVSPEHMEFFGSIDAVAKEELAVCDFSKTTFVGADYIDQRFTEGKNIRPYDLSDLASVVNVNELKLISDHSLSAAAAATVVAKELGLNEQEITAGLRSLKPINGRMSKLAGINGTTLIDDTYNSSPKAATAALDYLYSLKAPQRIALLGNMNELGDQSAELHREVGQYCDPAKLDLVVTLGVDANKYLAEAAEQKGCKVIRATSPAEAAKTISEQSKKKATVLLKGSQNGVFAEEATKLLLNSPRDRDKLVRQSNFWINKKRSLGIIQD